MSIFVCVLLGIAVLLIVAGLVFVVWGMRRRLDKATVNPGLQADEQPRSSIWEQLIPLMKEFVTTVLSKQSTPAEALVAGGFLLIFLGVIFAAVSVVPIAIGQASDLLDHGSPTTTSVSVVPTT